MLIKRALIVGCFIALLAPGVLSAAPTAKLSGDGFTIKEGVTYEILAQINAEKGKIKSGHLAFRLEAVNNEDLKKLCSAFPGMTGLVIQKSKEVTTLAPIAELKELRLFQIENIAATDVADHLPASPEMLTLRIETAFKAPDLKWISAMTKLTSLTVNNRTGGELRSLEGLPSLPGITSTVFSGEGMKPADLTPLAASMPNLKTLKMTGATLPDLTPLGTLANLEVLDFYGVTVKDFSPLAACPKLKQLTYYAVKDANFSSLGALTQIQELKGGLTKLVDISWVENLPNLKKFDVFAEYVTDYRPLTKTNIEEFQIWNMRSPVGDMGFLGEIKSLKKLTIWNMDDVTNVAPLAALSELKELHLKDLNVKSGEAVDISFIAELPALTKLEISKSKIAKFDTLASTKALEQIRLAEIDTIDCTVLGKMPALKTLELYKIEAANLEGLAASATLEGITLRDPINMPSLAPLTKIPNLKRVSGVKGKFPEDQLTAFPQTVKVN